MADSHEDNYWRKLARRIARHLQGTMVGGLLLLVPVIITYVVLKWLFEAIDGILQPAIREAFNTQVPGLGLIVLVLLLYIAGLAEENFLVRRILDMGRAMLLRIPIVSTVYSSAKQLIDALSGAESSSFRQVVMIEYPRKDAWAIGFLTGSTTDKYGASLSIIFIPTAPTPNSGWVALIPDGDVFYTDLTVPTAMRLVLSGGIIAPSIIRTRQVS
jgi:uncharacterized membrane protein